MSGLSVEITGGQEDSSGSFPGNLLFLFSEGLALRQRGGAVGGNRLAPGVFLPELPLQPWAPVTVFPEGGALFPSDWLGLWPRVSAHRPLSTADRSSHGHLSGAGARGTGALPPARPVWCENRVLPACLPSWSLGVPPRDRLASSESVHRTRAVGGFLARPSSGDPHGDQHGGCWPRAELWP